MVCPLLGVSRSGYCDWRGRAPSRRQSEDAWLTVELRSAFEQSRRTYGRPRLRHALAARGLRACIRRCFVPQTTQSRHDGPIAPNRLAQRAAQPTRPDKVSVVDMTCIETAEGRLFLAIVLGLHSRKFVGWAFAQSLHTALPLAALRMVIAPPAPPAACSTTAIAAITCGLREYQPLNILCFPSPASVRNTGASSVGFRCGLAG